MWLFSEICRSPGWTSTLCAHYSQASYCHVLILSSLLFIHVFYFSVSIIGVRLRMWEPLSRTICVFITFRISAKAVPRYTQERLSVDSNKGLSCLMATVHSCFSRGICLGKLAQSVIHCLHLTKRCSERPGLFSRRFFCLYAEAGFEREAHAEAQHIGAQS